jgi:transposase
MHARAAAANDPHKAKANLKVWLSWAKRCQLDPFKTLAKTLSERADAVVRGMTDNRTNAFVEAMNGLLQQVARRAISSPSRTFACPS